mgnify:CR=1 FL=1|jgi:hypothetical protein
MGDAARALFHDHEVDVFDRHVRHPSHHESHYIPGVTTPHRRRVAPIPKVHARGDDRLAFLLKRRPDGRAIKTPIHIQCWNDRHAGKVEQDRRLMRERVAEEKKQEHHLAHLRHSMHVAEKRARERERAAQAHFAHCLMSHDNHLSWDSRDVKMSLNRDEILARPPAGQESARRWHEMASSRANPLQGVGNFEQARSKRSSRRDRFVAEHHHHHARKGLAGPTLRRALALSPRAYPENIPEQFMRRRAPAEERRREMLSKMEKRAWAEERKLVEEERTRRSAFDMTLGKKVCEALRLNKMPLRGSGGGLLPSIRRRQGGKGEGSGGGGGAGNGEGVRRWRRRGRGRGGRLGGRKWY